MAAPSTAVARRAGAGSPPWLRLGLVALVLLAAVLVVPLFFAGSRNELPPGTRVGSVAVGGLSPAQATSLLERRAAQLATVPITFTAGAKRFRLTARELGVAADWRSAVDSAARTGGGIGIVRGYRRLRLELFPRNVAPATHVYAAALAWELARIEKAVDRPHRDARLVRRGLHVTIAAGAAGRALGRAAARERIVAALASFARRPVALPVEVDVPHVTVDALTAAQRRASTIVSAPVRARVGPLALRIPRWRLATVLDLRTLRFDGARADRFFARLARQVDRTPRDAAFAVERTRVRIVPAQPGRSLDVPRAASKLLAAASRPAARAVVLPVVATAPARSTRTAEAMGITGVVGSYETLYGGDPNRVHNVQLVAHLVDGKLIAPGSTFSFNRTTGERSAAKGFLEAPVIVNGELQTGLGGGVCQVSTTVFNAAFEAGLPITARTNHALYISHYPLGRDATVDYPTVDLRFVNDTGHWLLLRTWVGSSSLTVGLYGTPTHRRVEAVTQPLRVVAPPPVQKTVDATLAPGEVVVDDPGVPAQSTSVERKVYGADARLLSDETWYSSYRAEPRVVRVGPKAKAKTKKQKAPTRSVRSPEPPH